MGSNQSSDNTNNSQLQQEQQQQQNSGSCIQKKTNNKKIQQKRFSQQSQQSVFSYQTQQVENAKYDDDEPIDELQQKQQKESVKNMIDKKQENFDLNQNLSFELTSMTKAIKLNNQETQFIPTMVSIDTIKQTKENKKDDENVLDNRPAVDLICVIDRSGSMGGNKIEQVKQTLLYLLELLNENDRLMLVQFDHMAQRILPLTRCSKQNAQKIKQAIESLRSAGGTRISNGMALAYKGILERKYQNPVSSVFLLSDGQDSSGCVQYLEQQNIQNDLPPFTINCFGFGSDHDPVLMNEICKIKDGNFYYVEKIETVDEMFIDALGGLFSVIAQNLQITLKLQRDNKVFGDVSVSKTYGDMWHYNQEQNQYEIKMIQLISGVTKEYLLEIQLPPIEYTLQDHERNPIMLTAELELFSNSDTDKKNPIKKQAALEMTFYNQNEQIPQENITVNENVELNYLRVRGADTIQQVMQEAEKGNYEQGQQIIAKVRQDIEKAKPENRKRLQMLVDDLEESKDTCNKERYQNEGRFKMISQNKCHMEKKSRNRQKQQAFSSINEDDDDNMDMYQNSCQKAMVKTRRAQKY